MKTTVNSTEATPQAPATAQQSGQPSHLVLANLVLNALKHHVIEGASESPRKPVEQTRSIPNLVRAYYRAVAQRDTYAIKEGKTTLLPHAVTPRRRLCLGHNGPKSVQKRGVKTAARSEEATARRS